MLKLIERAKEKECALNSKNLKIAGWLAMASAFLTLPLVFISSWLDGKTDVESTVMQSTIQLVGTFLAIAILLYLKRFLTYFFNFHLTDQNIDLMVLISIISGILSVTTLYISPNKVTLEYIVIALLVIQGIVQVQFGYRLLKLPENLGGMLKPFCYANMITGMLLASVLLIPGGIFVSALSDLMLGTIFLNASKIALMSETTMDSEC